MRKGSNFDKENTRSSVSSNKNLVNEDLSENHPNTFINYDENIQVESTKDEINEEESVDDPFSILDMLRICKHIYVVFIYILLLIYCFKRIITW